MSLAEVVNLYSDTQTRPTEGMRRAIASADVADEQRLADPTTNRLQERVAELLGQEAALFLPSGTMCNQISFRLHARPGGDERILDRSAHTIIAEAGGPASNAQLMIHALEARAASSRPSSSGPPSGTRPTVPAPVALVSVERPPTWAVGACGRSRRSPGARLARDRGLRTHLDGRGSERRGSVAHERQPSSRADSTPPGSTSPRDSARPSRGSRRLGRPDR